MVGAMVIFAGNVYAEPTDFGVYTQFYQRVTGFFGRKEVKGKDYTVELRRQNHLSIRATDNNTEIAIVDVGSDGFGHDGDNAVCKHMFSDGSLFTMNINCRDSWKYCIKSKLSYLQNGTNAVAEAEFDPSTCLRFIPFGERIVRSRVRPVERYAGIIYADLVQSSLVGKQSEEVPYKDIKEVFDKVESDLLRIKKGDETLGHSLVEHSGAFVTLAKMRIRNRN